MMNYISIFILFLVATHSGLSFSSEISTTLIPETLIGDSITKEIDWLIDNVNAPKTEFGKVIAGQLKTNGIASSISATYKNKFNSEEIYSLEVYEFTDDFLLEKSVILLKPMILEDAEVSHFKVSGYPAIEIKHNSYGLELLAVKTGSRLVIIGIVNNTGNISLFAQRYFSWFSKQPFQN